MKSIIAVLLFVFCWLASTDAKNYKRCDLAKELVEKHHFSRTMLSMWMCMLQAENVKLDTKKIDVYKPIVSNGNSPYKSYGLFQINSKNYCGVGYVGGKCKVRCEDLASDNIAKSALCAQIVLNTEGFKAWKMWESKCKPPQNIPPMNDCFNKKDINTEQTN